MPYLNGQKQNFVPGICFFKKESSDSFSDMIFSQVNIDLKETYLFKSSYPNKNIGSIKTYYSPLGLNLVLVKVSKIFVSCRKKHVSGPLKTMQNLCTANSWSQSRNCEP